MIEPEPILFPASEWVPNHPFLPALVYDGVTPAGGDGAEWFEHTFAECGWQGMWRNGIFSYQHYHVGAHEVLGIAGGHAELLIGGPTGTKLLVREGDCLVLPAGTGHMRLSRSEDFLVVGGYPPGQYADIETHAATPGELEIIARLPIPMTDPLYGPVGPLVTLWSRAASNQAA